MTTITKNFTLTASNTPPRIVAPLTGTVTRGTWVTNQSITVAAMPNGFMRYNYLLPAQYSSSFIYPLLMYGHPNDEGMSGGSYPSDGNGLVAAEADGAYNTVNFRTKYPAIIVVPHCDQSIDTSGANGNANFGGYLDTPNSGGNEQGINALLLFMQANFSVDVSRCYAIGDSLGGIGTCAWVNDNNRVNGVHKYWAGGAGLSDNLYRPSSPTDNTRFEAMRNVLYIAVSTPTDNDPNGYDHPAWQYYNGNANYPQENTYNSGGIAACKANGANFYYVEMQGGFPTPYYLGLNEDGQGGSSLYNLLFNTIV
jgi:hypothetical protein